ncbi:MAG: hypothetical protein ACK4MJ_09970, partial [Hylemonella sp.]
LAAGFRCRACRGWGTLRPMAKARSRGAPPVSRFDGEALGLVLFALGIFLGVTVLLPQGEAGTGFMAGAQTLLTSQLGWAAWLLPVVPVAYGVLVFLGRDLGNLSRRVLGGTVAEGQGLHLPEGGAEKPSGLLSLFGQQASRRGAAGEGETVALAKLDGAQTGMLLGLKEPIRQWMPFRRPEPVMGLAISTADHKDDVKLSAALHKLTEEDPALHARLSEATGETLLEGQGEMHLRVALARLKGKYGLTVEARAPQIAYRETIRKGTSVRGRH